MKWLKVTNGTISAFAAILTLISCGDENLNGGSIDRVFFESSDVSSPEEDSGTYVLIEEGENTVFRFGFHHPHDDLISDDELSEFFYIEMPSLEADEFQMDSNALISYASELYYVRSCFCAWESFVVSKFQVSGKKIASDSWEIDFDIKAISGGEEYTLKDKGVYTLTTRP